MIRRILLTLAATALTFVGAAPAALADTTYTACNGVWVVVDYGSLGGVSTACATSFSTGTAALRSAGFTPTLDNGFLEKINGKPAAPDRQTAYWSYWQATRQSDGSYSGWKYANTGANSSHPTKGNAEGWHYVSVSGASAPGATPPKNPAEAPSSAPSPTKSSSAPSPTKTASAKPSATKSSTSSATATPTASSAKPKSPSPTPSQSSSVSPSPSVVATSPPASFPPGAPSADPIGSDAPAGSPTAVIVTASALAVGAAGAGGWWLWRGRRR